MNYKINAWVMKKHDLLQFNSDIKATAQKNQTHKLQKDNNNIRAN